MSNMLALHGIDTEHFLKHYWQQKALFMPAALPDFHSPLDEHDLAALAMQDGIEARLISEDNNGQWHLQHGPFDEYTLQNPPHQKWTLLVQAVDLWLEEVAELKNYFHFLPSFRLDDIMISYAPKGGSVGAHFDYYDVFLIQAQGKRRWQIGQKCDEHTARPTD